MSIFSGIQLNSQQYNELREFRKTSLYKDAAYFSVPGNGGDYAKFAKMIRTIKGTQAEDQKLFLILTQIKNAEKPILNQIKNAVKPVEKKVVQRIPEIRPFQDAHIQNEISLVIRIILVVGRIEHGRVPFGNLNNQDLPPPPCG